MSPRTENRQRRRRPAVRLPAEQRGGSRFLRVGPQCLDRRFTSRRSSSRLRPSARRRNWLKRAGVFFSRISRLWTSTTAIISSRPSPRTARSWPSKPSAQTARSSSGRIPNREIVPRLLYHRHFMLTEQMKDAPAELQARMAGLVRRTSRPQIWRGPGQADGTDPPSADDGDGSTGHAAG